MARIAITITGHGELRSGSLHASRPVEPPRIRGWHSVGGGRGVPAHDRAAHAAGRPHVCAEVRSATYYHGHSDMTAAEMRAVLAAQYRAHDIEWRGR